MSSGSTAMAGAGAMSQCCSTTTLLGAVAASFACCSLLVAVFLSQRFLHLSRSWPHSARLLREHGQEPKLGLDATAIALLPSFPYRRRECSASSSAAAADECAVCLSDVVEGEVVRQLPGCEHVFHRECVDAWLASNASCPVCRAKAAPPAAGVRADERAAASAMPFEASIDNDEMVVWPSLASGAPAPPRPELLGAPAPRREVDLERQ